MNKYTYISLYKHAFFYVHSCTGERTAQDSSTTEHIYLEKQLEEG